MTRIEAFLSFVILCLCAAAVYWQVRYFDALKAADACEIRLLNVNSGD